MEPGHEQAESAVPVAPNNVVGAFREGWFQHMISEIKDYAIISMGRDGTIASWNKGAQYIKGYEAAEILGKNFRLFYTPNDLENDLPGKLLKEAMETGRAANEGFRVRKDGSVFWASVVITALHDKEENIIGFSKVTRDLTQRKMVEEELSNKNQALEQANVELSSFAFIASHDLKEPLRKIQVFTSRIADIEKASDKSMVYVEKIMSSAARMQRLIDDLLSFSKLTRLEQPVEFDMNRILEEVQSDLEILISEKRASVTIGKLPSLKGIPFQFHQLFHNLFTNSLKFCKPGERPLIAVSCETITGPVPLHGIMDHREYYLIKVADNGIGFDPAHARKIFDVFYRLHSRESFEGTGIGLAIVKKVVENHQGAIATEGTPGKGATFFIYLPKEVEA